MRDRDERCSALTDGSLWMNVHIVFVLGLIVVYYVLIFEAIFVLLRVTVAMVDPWPLGIASLVWGILFVAAVAVILQLAWHVVQSLPTLIIAKHDVVAEDADGILLSRDDHPEFHQLVDEVADSIGGLVPDELRLTQLPQCYVVEKRHLGIEERHRNVLVLGLPHVEVLSVAELKVIIAHELVHFRFRDAMLRVYFFRFLESLRITCQSMERTPWRCVNPLYLFCRCYRHLSQLLTAPIRRAQELRADRMSAAIYGGQLAVATLLNEWLVASQFDLAAAQSLEAGRKANVFHVFAEHWRRFTPEGQDYLQRRLAEEEKPSIWNSHPTMHERIAAIERFPDQAQPDAAPARRLLKNIPELEDQLQHRLAEALRSS